MAKTNIAPLRLPVTRVAPFGVRGYLSQPKGPSTDAPASKVTGDPKIALTQQWVPPLPRKKDGPSQAPEPVLSAFSERLVSTSPSPTDQATARLRVLNADRQQRARKGKTSVGNPDKARMSGMDFVRGAKQKPRLPDGFSHVPAKTAQHTVRGSRAIFTQMPETVVNELARKAVKAELLGPGVKLPISTVETEAPIKSSGTPMPLPPEPIQPTSAVETAGAGFMKLAFLGAAVFVAVLVVRG